MNSLYLAFRPDEIVKYTSKIYKLKNDWIAKHKKIKPSHGIFLATYKLSIKKLLSKY